MDRRALETTLVKMLMGILMGMLVLASAGVRAEPVQIKARDGTVVFGELWPAAAKGAPLILAFHQAGSNHSEYTPLASRLNKAGFSVLTIDQRSGGAAFGGVNKTVAALGRSASYDAALPDLETALDWAKTRHPGVPVLVWGSSYSAALVFLLAAKHPSDIQGLLAFSPGEYLQKPDAVHMAAKLVKVPVFIDQAADADEEEQSRSILAALPGTDKVQFIAKQASVHGSSTLRTDRNPSGAEEHWRAVLAFIAQFRLQR